MPCERGLSYVGPASMISRLLCRAAPIVAATALLSCGQDRTVEPSTSTILPSVSSSGDVDVGESGSADVPEQFVDLAVLDPDSAAVLLEAELRVTGTATPGAVIQVLSHSVSTTADLAGDWSFVVRLTPGPNRLRLRASRDGMRPREEVLDVIFEPRGTNDSLEEFSP